MKLHWIACGALFAASGLLLAQTTRPSRQAPTTQPAATQPSADQVMDQMLAPAGRQPAAAPQLPTGVTVDKSSAKGAVAPKAPAVLVLREGTFMVDRVGRMARTPDGSQYEFIFEADGKTLKDPPVILLPNLKLMSMEAAVNGGTRDYKFRVTGMVTEYKGRNYLLLEKVVVIPDAANQF